MVTLKTPTGPIETTGGPFMSDDAKAQSVAGFLGQNRKDASKMGLTGSDDKKRPR